MDRTVLKSKLHRARVTASNKEYEGSITINRDLLEAANILPYEKVQVVNVTNGERFETYAITGDIGEVCLNGAAARLGETGDVVIVMSYGTVSQAETLEPTVVSVDDNNESIAT